MRRIDGRVRKLEDRLGITPAPRVLIVLTDREFPPAEEQAYLTALEKAGSLRPNGFGMALLTRVPPGLSPEEMERFVRQRYEVPAPTTSPVLEVVIENRSTK